ncbi:dTDP-4-amino-4,6-dideoxygalactose transaminase [Lewinella marina]|uniref:dTDP-4-amino-4,6-dideoxygalactose transaminase n=1 Tax=Neolewinella marina TaxID=438751 RepID=A0A2G0CBV9_9BACT|nr:dTDP-4-amino-4,6-dideoxygalactose transaminase [Neolewinella marina]NJB86655.1 dTDP-4-amino-4,6-dideoxygalactose transaminase [Neolewinella marina]PHK97463.1 dTDP-4-amino-4,6-dideoxygalactose transaminase [Neolewinella marina]
MNKIPFNVPFIAGTEVGYMQDAIQSGKLSGDGKYTKLAHQLLETQTSARKVLLTTSCTHALELAALLLNIQVGDEVILPSYTFVSTANPFVLRGAKMVYVDIHPETMNIDERLIEAAVTHRTKAIVPVHYGGVGCNMGAILDIAQRHSLYVVEDAAQCIGATYKGKALGTLGHLGAISFHDTKNIHCGEGGALLINDPAFIHRAEIIREKGTNRTKFLRGEIDKYTWVDKGSSYLPSELNAAFLYGQLLETDRVTSTRREIWSHYQRRLQPLAKTGRIGLAETGESSHNGHLFFLKCRDIEERQELIEFLKQRDIYTVFHYIPLHSAIAGHATGTFHGQDIHTTRESERLLRLPLYVGLTTIEVDRVCSAIEMYYGYPA